MTMPRRILQLALAGDRVAAFTETGMSLDRVIQQALWIAENDPSIDDADLIDQVLAKRDAARARRASDPLR